MTDPTGRSFLSYRSTCSDDASLLIAAQHDLGIPTWRDRDDLAEVPTEDEIRKILKDEKTANAILWLTPDIQDSSAILKTEVQIALERARHDETFFVVPVLARGLTFADVDKVLGETLTAEVLRTWNLRPAGPERIGPEDAFKLAGRVLERRIAAIDRALPKGQPIRLALYSRSRAPFRPGEIALTLDWCHRFRGHEATAQAWDDHLIPGLKRIADLVEEKAHGRPVAAEGLPVLPGVIALGSVFLRQKKIPLSWSQHMLEGPEQLWSLQAGREPSGLRVQLRAQEDSGTDLAVLVSVNEDVPKAFAASKPSLPRFRAMVVIEPERTSAGEFQAMTIENPSQAADAAWAVAEGIKSARRSYPGMGCTHLFMAVPAGLAMMVGQLLSTLGSIQTYQHVGPGEYRPAARLRL